MIEIIVEKKIKIVEVKHQAKQWALVKEVQLLMMTS
jgi:hypothetical protein